MRDDFSLAVKRICAERVVYRCSNPKCRRLTSGPQRDPSKSLNLGVCAHITAAAPGGPRYDSKLSVEERKSIDNAIWLCQYCAKLVDNDELRYSVGKLRQWKHIAEQDTLSEVEGYIKALEIDTIWLWDDARHQYRNTQTGKIVDGQEIMSLRDVFIDHQKVAIDKLVRQLVDKELTIQDWLIKMREIIKSTYVALYVLSIGGKSKLTTANKGYIEERIREKIHLLQEMAEDIVNKRYIEDDLEWVQEYMKFRAQAYLDPARREIEWSS